MTTTNEDSIDLDKLERKQALDRFLSWGSIEATKENPFPYATISYWVQRYLDET